MARYTWRLQGFEQIRFFPKTREIVDDCADDIVEAANAHPGSRPGFVASMRNRDTRYGGIIYADTWPARHYQKKNNILQKVLQQKAKSWGKSKKLKG